MSQPSALITGGTSGIGLATAVLLHRRGYRVLVTGRNPQTLAAARAELPDEVEVFAADSRSLTDAERVAEHVAERFGRLDALFLNAGVIRRAPVDAVDEATYDEVFDTNTKGQFFTLKHLLPLLAHGASVVFTVGIGVTRGMTGASLAAASRGALLAMVPSLAVEFAPRRIRVNAVSPGAIDTPMWSKNAASPDALSATMQSVSAGIPLQRFGTAQEVAETVGFLVGEESRYVTGQNIVVSGGL